MSIDTRFPERCLDTRDAAMGLLQSDANGELNYVIYRAACIREFEPIRGQSGKFLRKCLANFTDAVQDSTIPILVEARDWTSLPEHFHKEIEHSHVVFCHGES